MATLPTITCRAAFGQAFTNGTPTWTDISAYFRRASTRRGRSRLQRTAAQFQAGTATIALDNRDRRFDPTNTASPYYPNIQPGVLLNLRATWAGTTYDLFTGYVDNWPVRWPGRAEAETEIPVTDLFGILAKRLIVSAGYAAVVAADSPQGYWRLDDVAGTTTVLDSSGNGFNGFPSGAVTFGAGGLIQSSAASSASIGQETGAAYDGFVTLPSAASISGTGAFTVEMWVRRNSATSTGSLIFAQANAQGAGTDSREAILIEEVGGLSINVSDGTNAGSNNVNITAAGVTLADLLPHHIVLTRSGTTYTLYVDGVVAATATSTAWNVPAKNMNVGAGAQTGAALFGDYAQVATYNTALSSTRVAAHYNAGKPFVQQTTGARVNAVLDAVGFPATMRRVDAGRTLVPVETRSLATTTSLAYLQACETAEQGQLLVGPDGYVEFHNRYSRYGSAGAANQATFGDQAGELGIPVGAFNIDYDTTELFNTVPATRFGGATQIATDKTGTTGTDKIGERTAPGLSDVMLTSDADALALAQWILADTKTPTFRLDKLPLDPRGDASLWPHVLGRTINDTVTANKHTVPGGGAAISLPSRIEGIDHTFGDLKWQTDLHLSQMGTSKWMILNDSTCDALDGTNRLGW